MTQMHGETLDLAHMSDAQFDTLYRDRIEPLFRTGEADRLKAVATFRQRISLGAPLALALAVATFLYFHEGVAALIVGAIAGVVAFTVAYLPLQKVADSVKAASLNAISEAIGVRYRGSDAPLASLSRFKSLDLLPGYDRSHFEDFFHGERQGCAFDLCEAKLEDERRDKDGDREYVTVFRGQIIRIAFPKAFLGVTVVKRDIGVFNALRGMGELKRVTLGDSTFEKAFEVYSSDQVEARYLVHPVFMERLIHLEQAFNGRKIRCGFQDGDLLIAVEGENKFEIGDMFKPLADPARARKIVDDIAEVMRLMDAVVTAEQGALLAYRARKTTD
jgi:Protein of unknown function (DUF3137)